MDFPAMFDFSTALRETDRILHPDGAGDVPKQRTSVATGGIFGVLYTHHNPHRSNLYIYVYVYIYICIYIYMKHKPIIIPL